MLILSSLSLCCFLRSHPVYVLRDATARCVNTTIMAREINGTDLFVCFTLKRVNYEELHRHLNIQHPGAVLISRTVCVHTAVDSCPCHTAVDPKYYVPHIKGVRNIGSIAATYAHSTRRCLRCQNCISIFSSRVSTLKKRRMVYTKYKIKCKYIPSVSFRP